MNGNERNDTFGILILKNESTNKYFSRIRNSGIPEEQILGVLEALTKDLKEKIEKRAKDNMLFFDE